MKIQDVAFIIILAILLLLRKEQWLVLAGLISLTLAIPLFAKWVFFTAERLTWYAGAFFLVAIVSMIFTRRKVL
jgi:hypothetical protein